MEEENLMEFSTPEAEAENSHYYRTARRSSLKVPKADQDTATNLKRRVSFASSSTVKPFATDPEKVTIWDTTYEEEMNTNDSSKMSNDGSLEVDEMNTSCYLYADNNVMLMKSKMEINIRKLKLPKDKEEFLMDKENFYIHKNDEVPNMSSNQVQIYEDSTCNSDMNITMGGAPLVETESNQTKHGTEEIKFSLGLLENFVGAKKMSKTQQFDESMEFTSNLPVDNIVCNKVESKPLLDITMGSSDELENMQPMDQSMLLTANLPVTHLFSTNIKSAQIGGDIIGQAPDDKKFPSDLPEIFEDPGQTNTQQIDQSLQLTENIPGSYIITTNVRIVQTETNLTKFESDMDISVGSLENTLGSEKSNMSQLDQNMQLTENLPVKTIFRQKGGSNALPGQGSEQAMDSQQMNQSMQLTENLPVKSILRQKGGSNALPDNYQGSEEATDTQQMNQSMQLTENLPVKTIFRQKGGSNALPGQGSEQAMDSQQTNQSMQLTENLPVKSILRQKGRSNALPDNYQGSEEAIDTQQMNQSMQLTENLPVKTILPQKGGSNALSDNYPGSEQTIDPQHMNESMQLTTNLPVISSINSTTNCAQKGDATNVKPDRLEFTFGVSENLDKARGPTNTKIFHDLPVVPAIGKSLLGTSKLFGEISGTIDTTCDLLKSVDSSRKGITNLDEEGVIKDLNSMSLSREASMVDDVTRLRNTTRIFHGLHECVPSVTNFGKNIRQTSKNVKNDQVHSASSPINNQKFAEMDLNVSNLPILKNKVLHVENETVEEFQSNLPTNKSECIESRLSKVAISIQIDEEKENLQISDAEFGEISTLQNLSNEGNLKDVTLKDSEQVLTERITPNKNIAQTLPISRQTFFKTNTSEILKHENKTRLTSALPLEHIESIFDDVSINKQIKEYKENLSDVTLKDFEDTLTDRITLDKQVAQENQSLSFSSQRFVETLNTAQSFSNIENSCERFPIFTESVLDTQQNNSVSTEPSFSNKDVSEDIEIEHSEVKQLDFSNYDLEAEHDLELSSRNLQGSPNLTKFDENMEVIVEESSRTTFGGLNRVGSINPAMALLKVPHHVEMALDQLMKLMDDKRIARIEKEDEENNAIEHYCEQWAIRLDERDKKIKNMLDEKKNLGKLVLNKYIQEEFEKVMNANKVPDNDAEPSESTTTKLEEKVSELFASSKECWRFCGTSKNKQQYYFTAIYETVPFEVHVTPNSPTVCDVKSCQNIKANSSTLCKYNARVLEYHLSKENLSVALGNNYDLLTLLDYVYMVMERIIAFHQHFLELRKNHGILKLKIDPDFNVCFELVRAYSLTWWTFNLKLSITAIGHYDSLNIRSLSIEEVNMKDIEHMAKKVPKGPEFLKNFINNAIDYVNRYTHTYTNE